MKKRMWASIFIMIFCGLSKISYAGPASGEPFYVAFAYPMTGDLAQYGKQAYDGVMIKLDEVNANGGVNGRPIVMDVFDDKGDAGEAVKLAQMISDNKKYIAVFGSYNSPCSLASAPIYAKNKLVQFVPTAGHADLPNHEYTFVQALGAPLEFQLFSKLAVEQLKAKRISLIYINNDNGFEVLAALAKWVPEYGGQLVSAENFDEGQMRDFTFILTKIRAANPDLVAVNASYRDTADMLIQAKQMGFAAKFLLGPGSHTDAFIEAAGEAATGHYVASSFASVSPSPGVQKFSRIYRERTGNEANAMSQQPYESASMLVKALEAGATDRAGLYDVLMSWTFWEGDTYSAPLVNRRPQRDNLILLTVEDGKFTFVD